MEEREVKTQKKPYIKPSAVVVQAECRILAESDNTVNIPIGGDDNRKYWDTGGTPESDWIVTDQRHDVDGDSWTNK